MRRSLAPLAAVLITALVLPSPAHGSAALFTSDQAYFAPAASADASTTQNNNNNNNRVAYETFGEAGLASLVNGMLGLDEVDTSAATTTSTLPAWVNAEELTRTPPEVVVVYEGAQYAAGADLAAGGVAEAVRRALFGGGGSNNKEGGSSGSSVAAPHAGLFGGDASTYTPTAGSDIAATISARVLAALGEAKRKGAAKAGGRHFLAGACDESSASLVGGGKEIVKLKQGDELADFMSQRSGAAAAATAADVVVICGNPSPTADAAAPAAALEAEVGSFAAFVEGLREAGVRHAAVYAAASATAAAAGGASQETCLVDMAAKAEKALEAAANTAGSGGRALLLTGATSPPPPAAAAGYVCDDLCKLQVNIIVGLDTTFHHVKTHQIDDTQYGPCLAPPGSEQPNNPSMAYVQDAS
jgi:hypothetical protein